MVEILATVLGMAECPFAFKCEVGVDNLFTATRFALSMGTGDAWAAKMDIITNMMENNMQVNL
jgi:hypothetical protein